MALMDNDRDEFRELLFEKNRNMFRIEKLREEQEILARQNGEIDVKIDRLISRRSFPLPTPFTDRLFNMFGGKRYNG